MKNLRYFLAVALLNSSTYAQNAPQVVPKWNATLRVVDEEGKAVSGASAKIWYHVAPSSGQSIAMTNKAGLTDTNGVFFASGGPGSVELAYEAQKTGYYPAGKSYELGLPGQYGPERWTPSLTLLLKKVGIPIPMYARRVETKIPKENQGVGFDLTIGDWVEPFGKGKDPDFLFIISRKVTNDREYEAQLRLAFSNPSDGIIALPPAPDTGSELVMPRPAPENGYQTERVWRHSDSSTGRSERPEPVLGYFFRIRTVLDDRGNVKSALYGKIHEDVRLYVGTRAPRAGTGFTYYLNPEPNSRNIEFDPKRNLFKNLPDREQVHSP